MATIKEKVIACAIFAAFVLSAPYWPRSVSQNTGAATIATQTVTEQTAKAEWWIIKNRHGADYIDAICENGGVSPADMYDFWKYEQPRIVDLGNEVDVHHIESGGEAYLIRYFKNKVACDTYIQKQRMSLDKYR